MDLNGPIISDDIQYIDDTIAAIDIQNNLINENNEQRGHDTSLSSDETIFLNLPTKCTQETLDKLRSINDCFKCNRINCICSANLMQNNPLILASQPDQIHSSDDSTTSSTSTPVNMHYNRVINEPYKTFVTEWSSSDEHTSFYNDKVSGFSSIPFKSTQQCHTPSDYFNSSYGAYPDPSSTFYPIPSSIHLHLFFINFMMGFITSLFASDINFHGTEK